MKYLRLSWLTFRNRLLEERRYPFQFVLNTLGFVIVGVLLAMGSVALLGDGDVGVNTAAIFTAFLAGAAISLPSDTLGKERQTLQEVYLRPLPTLSYIVAVCLGRGLELILTLSTLTLLVTLVGSADPAVVLRMLIVAVPIFASMLGLGLLLAGLKLIYQKLGILNQFLTLVFVGAALAAPLELLDRTAAWSPFSAGLLYLRSGEPNIWPMLITASVYLLIGSVAFTISERTMLARGLMNVE